ncbi:MAG: ornithine--oxo-acid transaminase [Chloroflexi bacterium]|jgi:ornithine--oxo-acid transaminase|nr:ornithine--oxo-acid transaminase [Chloroflexota bacterium]MBT4305730.1 ornithine--oxo-acid transaminase [Chloroflexota bacterium]MBT4533554.1 ornithine--oxo-acid transaminase [Chloroflexota bacterium]MBT4681803.1 ornithine--oxo-acid transaminase [Chloroflexota bacterium]MBT4754125.1 ornithine--oxo-acid transaminase [Chloroflexota bacterium]
MNSQELIDLEEKYGAHNYHPLDVVITKGDGVWVWDAEGNKYLDCLSAYSALNQGHVHPDILKSLIDQAAKVTLTSRAFRNDQLSLFYKELAEMTGYEMSLPMNSGAEAVETALKLARKWAYTVKGVPRHQAEIIVAEGNFHGRTISIVTFSSEELYKDDFGPFTPGFPMVPYGDLGAMEAAINENTAAIMVEPIQGEGGVLIPPDGYLQGLRELCDKHNILLIFDEIQTGLGRTGKLFAQEHEGVRGDMTIIGKALSGGFYPVSAVLADTDLMGLFKSGEHGSTFGGNPLGAAVARASLKVIRDEKLVENADELGQYFIDQLAEIPSPHVKEVRGRGMLIGVELKENAGGARRFCEALQKQGILCKETHETVIRFAPPLVIDKETIDWALPIIREVLNMD